MLLLPHVNALQDPVCMQAAGFRSSLMPFASDFLGAIVMRTGLMFTLEEGQSLPLGWRATAAGCLPLHHGSVQLLRSTWVYLSLAFPNGAQVTVRGLPVSLTQHCCGGSFWCLSVCVRPEALPWPSSCVPHGCVLRNQL